MIIRAAINAGLSVTSNTILIRGKRVIKNITLFLWHLALTNSASEEKLKAEVTICLYVVHVKYIKQLQPRSSPRC